MKKARITQIASYLPEKVLTNAELETMVQTSDDWIVSRTGMKERRIAAADQGSSDMGAEAASRLLKKAALPADQIDLILVATMTPDYVAPSTAALIQAKLQAVNAAAVDLQAACTGFLYGLSMAKAYVESGMYKNVLLVASEKMSSFIDYTDRNTCILFGDGASAALVTSTGPGLIVEAIQLGADGLLPHLAMVPSGGSKSPATIESVTKREHFFKMEGKELFKHAVRRMAAAAQKCLADACVTEAEISWIVPHQANARIIDAVGKTFSVDDSRVYRTVHKYGNTSASSISIALDELLQEHQVQVGERLLLAAFGAGLTWGAAILRKVDHEV